MSGPTARRRWSTRGLLNLTHRVDPPALLVPGEPYEIEVEMEATSWVFPAGHSIRLSIAGNDWPNTWVPPQPVTLTVESLQMQLPVLPAGRRRRAPRSRRSSRQYASGYHGDVVERRATTC